MKRCPTCGRELADAAASCEACDAWAASIVEPSFLDEIPLAAPPEPVVDAASDPVIVAAPEADILAAPEPAAAAAAASAAAPSRGGVPPTGAAPSAAPARRREMLVVGAAVAGAVLVVLAVLLTRGGPASSVAAAPAVPVAAAAPRTPAPAPAPSGARQRWTAETRAQWLGNARHGAAFELPAENMVVTWFGPSRPSLVVRCTARTLQAFVFTGSPMKIEPNADGKTVTVSVDDEPVRTERWPDSDEHDALFAPDGAAFVQRLLRARTLRFGYTPHNSSDVVAQFEVSGLAALIEPAAKECGWQK